MCTERLVGSALTLVLAGAGLAQAQAWVGPKGEMSVTLGLSHSFADEHLDSSGNVVMMPYYDNVFGLGTMKWNTADLLVEYGISDRFSLSVGLPLVVSGYWGNFPHAGLPGHQNIDDGAWHTTFQDFRGALRFQATRGTVAVTPAVGLIVPSHGYEYFAHSAAGRHLREAAFGVSVGVLLDPWLRDSYVQASYAFTVPEKVLGISHNRSNLFLEAGYLATSALTLSVIGAWEHSYGGWRAPEDFPADPTIEYHDQLARSNYLRLGGQLGYALTNSVGLSLVGWGTVRAETEVNMASVELSVTWSFSPAQLLKKKHGPAPVS